jgi:hypothetical protein
MADGIHALLRAQRRIHPRGNDCRLYPNDNDWNLSAIGLTLIRLRLY